MKPALAAVTAGALFLASILGSATEARAQHLIGGGVRERHFQGPSRDLDFPSFGQSVGNAGDFDDDGYDDLVIGSHRSNVSGAPVSGSVFVVSSETGRLLQHFHSPHGFAWFGWEAVGCGDIDRDGTPDLLVGALYDTSGGGNGAVYALSGASGQEFYSLHGVNGLLGLGDEVEMIGDWNRDGWQDFALGAYRASEPGRTQNGAVLVHSGKDGLLLHDYRGAVDGSYFGRSVAGGGDINADGHPDLLVGAVFDRPQSSLTFFSGADGSVFLKLWGAPDSGFGANVAIIGDVNLDGHADYAVGTDDLVGGQRDVGVVTAYSGRDHSVLWQAFGRGRYDYFGFPLAAAGDVNADGFPDLLACSARHLTSLNTPDGDAHVLSGPDGSRLLEFHEQHWGEEFATSAAGNLRSIHEPWTAVAIAAPAAGWFDSGRVSLFRRDPWIRSSVDSVSASSDTRARLDLDFPDDAGGYRYRVLLSATGAGPTTIWGVDVPLTSDALFARTLAGDVRMYSRAHGTGGRLDLQGDASAFVGFAAGALTSSIGRSFYGAAIAFSAPGGAGYSTGAVRFTVLP